MSCEFLKINGWWVPGVSGSPTETPVYVGSSERSASGLLRRDHVGTARSWRVELVDLSQSDSRRLRDELLSPAPHTVEFDDEVITAEVRYVRRVVPRFVQGGDLWSSNFTLTIEEIEVRR